MAADPAASAAAELGSFFRVMRLGSDDSSEQKPHAEQVPLPTPRPQNFVGESFTGTGYPPYVSGSLYASHFGAHSPRLNATAAAPRPPSATPELDAGVGPFVPAAPSHSSVESHSSLTVSPSPYASNSYQLTPSAPQLGAASFPWDDNSSLNPFASAYQSTLSAYPTDYRSWIPRPPRHYLTPEQVRSSLLRRSMEPVLLTFPGAAGHVASLLKEGDEEVRRSVLATVRHDVGCVTGSKERRDVLLALVRACTGRPDELDEIVRAVCMGIDFLRGGEKHNRGYVFRSSFEIAPWSTCSLVYTSESSQR
jgi:pumilio RNA-binding family